MTSTTSRRNAIILVIVVALANYSTKIVGVVEGGSISEDVEMQRNLHVLTGWQSQSNYYEPYYYYSGWGRIPKPPEPEPEPEPEPYYYYYEKSGKGSKGGKSGKGSKGGGY